MAVIAMCKSDDEEGAAGGGAAAAPAPLILHHLQNFRLARMEKCQKIASFLSETVTAGGGGGGGGSWNGVLPNQSPRGGERNERCQLATKLSQQLCRCFNYAINVAVSCCSFPCN